jgi:hypothetical protein
MPATGTEYTHSSTAVRTVKPRTLVVCQRPSAFLTVNRGLEPTLMPDHQSRYLKSFTKRFPFPAICYIPGKVDKRPSFVLNHADLFKGREHLLCGSIDVTGPFFHVRTGTAAISMNNHRAAVHLRSGHIPGIAVHDHRAPAICSARKSPARPKTSTVPPVIPFLPPRYPDAQ